MYPPRFAAVPISLFCSYSHRDNALRKRLEIHLSQLHADGIISGWHDRRLVAGTEWDGVIKRELERAGMILFLVSADFLASRYCQDIEVRRAMERHAAGTARVIPVILKPCDWRSALFARLAALPQGGKPVTKWPNRDEAFLDIACGIREAAKGLVERYRKSDWPRSRSSTCRSFNRMYHC